MTVPPVTGWEPWAPPLNPPHDGTDGQPAGLDAATAQKIADATWVTDPHLCAALQWEAYAAMLPPTPAVASVSTGAQSVSYSPAGPTGEFGLAMARAEYHRSLMGSLVTMPLTVAEPAKTSAPGNPWNPDAYDPWWPVA